MIDTSYDISNVSATKKGMVMMGMTLWIQHVNSQGWDHVGAARAM